MLRIFDTKGRIVKTVPEVSHGESWRYVFTTAGECLFFENSTYEIESRVSVASVGSGLNIMQGVKVVSGSPYINVY